jgi:acetyltransferase-like isoleucine patch superfamily enzyme
MDLAMSDYRSRFKSCGSNVTIADDAYIEHPEMMRIGDNVCFMRGFHMIGEPAVCRIGSNVTFWPYSFIQGSPDRFVIADHVGFYPNTYISLGGEGGVLEVGHHSHFAAHCALYAAGGLRLGAYCNIAAGCVLTTVAHKPDVTDQPMALAGAHAAPITLDDDVWLGANVTLVPGVSIARGCVIGAGAVVTKDTKPMSVYMGVPARYVRER